MRRHFQRPRINTHDVSFSNVTGTDNRHPQGELNLETNRIQSSSVFSIKYFSCLTRGPLYVERQRFFATPFTWIVEVLDQPKRFFSAFAFLLSWFDFAFFFDTCKAVLLCLEHGPHRDMFFLARLPHTSHSTGEGATRACFNGHLPGRCFRSHDGQASGDFPPIGWRPRPFTVFLRFPTCVL